MRPGALLPGTLAIAKRDSGNAKIGDAATTYAAQASCPSSCAFRDAGCYAETGRIGKFITAPLNATADEHTDGLAVAIAEAAAIDAMEVEPGRPMRLHTVGDCATTTAAVTVAGAAGRYMDRGGGQVWTYTHAWRDVPRFAWGRVSVLASCETAADVEAARDRHYAPALVVDEFRDHRRYDHDGTTVLPCPAQTRHDITCTDCRLCFDDGGLWGRGYAIGFEVHGSAFAKRHANLALLNDPLAGVTTRQWIGSYLDETGEWPTARQVVHALRVVNASAREMLDRMREERAA